MCRGCQNKVIINKKKEFFLLNTYSYLFNRAITLFIKVGDT
ncbi:hypothetical protein EMIT0210MI2_14026 [Priestia megaterium]